MVYALIRVNEVWHEVRDFSQQMCFGVIEDRNEESGRVVYLPNPDVFLWEFGGFIPTFYDEYLSTTDIQIDLQIDNYIYSGLVSKKNGLYKRGWCQFYSTTKPTQRQAEQVKTSITAADLIVRLQKLSPDTEIKLGDGAIDLPSDMLKLIDASDIVRERAK